MPLVPANVAPLIASAATGAAPAPGTPITAPQIEAIWLAIMNQLYPDMISNAVITTPPGVGVQVSPGTGSGATIAPGIGTIA